MAVLLGEVGVADDFVLVTEKPLRVDASGETVADVDLPGGAIRVRVLDDVTGAAVPQAHVLAYVNDTSSVRDLFPGWIYQPGWCATADATGSVVLPGLAVRGAHRVVAVRSTDLAEGQADAVVAGTWDSPTDVTVRIRRKEGK